MQHYKQRGEEEEPSIIELLHLHLTPYGSVDSTYFTGGQTQ